MTEYKVNFIWIEEGTNKPVKHSKDSLTSESHVDCIASCCKIAMELLRHPATRKDCYMNVFTDCQPDKVIKILLG